VTVAVPIAILEAEARFHRERLALYRARRYGGSRPTSEVRFRQLERASQAADENVRRALAERPAAK
jgi:hypothetical protein